MYVMTPIGEQKSIKFLAHKNYLAFLSVWTPYSSKMNSLAHIPQLKENTGLDGLAQTNRQLIAELPSLL